MCACPSPSSAKICLCHDIVGAGLDLCLGHAGDGNLHTEIIVRREDAEEMARGMRAGEAIVTYALELGGTIAGEHGVGYLKRQFLRQEHGNAVDVMRSIKALFDPNGIMNPGKILPPEE